MNETTYRDLLKRYIGRIINEEGTDFLYGRTSRQGGDVSFTQLEWDMLKKLSDDICREIGIS